MIRNVITVFASILMLSMPMVGSAQNGPKVDSDVVWIGSANGSEAEATMAAELRDLILAYDVEPWIITRHILIDETQIPHSHPVLTVHTRHIGDEHALLSTFIHEQLHWLEEGPGQEHFRAAMSDFEELFPSVPSSSDGGARDSQSTYLHLLICDMELQSMTTLVGEAAARKILARHTHYQWVYDKVLNDPRIRAVTLGYGFNASDGLSSR